ncbi:cation-translocating P-type ATPase, partial [Candidatus Daviesbacteria bacterium]|nr:cation-translocating P-type ATPase [Candidatus Daviesbacteria bacterium]
ETIQKAKNAGIKIVMVTGDHALTAKAIAEEIGLIEPGDEVLTGEQLNELSDETLKERIGKVRIFARVEPQHKLRIIKIYQRLGEVVSVTGDGVNDALALKQAHVGVAMGTTGTDVAKEASDLVILDDNLSTLVQAVEQGRLVYANILKTVKFLLSGNLSEILLIAVAVLAGLPTPLLPAQILWINFVTDGLPALALSMDSPSKHIMQSPPRRKNVGLLNSQSIHFILGYGGLIALICLLMFWGFLNMFNLEIARSYTFSLMVVLQMVLVFVMRRHHSVFSNKYLFWAAAFVLLSQALILYYPPFQSLFKVESGL